MLLKQAYTLLIALVHKDTFLGQFIQDFLYLILGLQISVDTPRSNQASINTVAS